MAELIIKMKKGNSIIEILLAIAVFGLILSGLATLIFSDQFLLTDASQDISAEPLAKNNLLLAENSLALNFYNPVSLSSTDPIFHSQVMINDIDNFTKEIQSIVSWKINGRDRLLELYSLVTDPADALGQSDCQLNGTEDWQAPRVYSGPGLGFGNQATGLFARGDYVYLSANNATPKDPKADPNDLFIINVSDPNNPFIVSKLDTGPGLSAIVAAGNYAYLGNSSINGQLEIVDISDVNDPKIVSNYKLPGNYSDGTTIANSIFYNRNQLFLGTAKSQIEELHVIDVTNALAPYEIGKWEAGAAVNSIYVNGNYLYLATPNSQELSVIDISDPANPKSAGGFDAPGGSGNGKSLTRDRNILYLGRTVGKNELYSLDISDPRQIKSLGPYAVSDSINSMAAYFNKIFLGTNSKFEILDGSSSVAIKLIGSIDLPAKATGISCSGRNFYVSLLSNDGLRIISPVQ